MTRFGLKISPLRPRMAHPHPNVPQWTHYVGSIRNRNSVPTYTPTLVRLLAVQQAFLGRAQAEGIYR